MARVKMDFEVIVSKTRTKINRKHGFVRRGCRGRVRDETMWKKTKHRQALLKNVVINEEMSFAELNCVVGKVDY